MNDERVTGTALGAAIDVIDEVGALDRIAKWARQRESRCVVAANVHVVVSAWRDPAYRAAINGADMTVPDGAPIAWLLRRQGHGWQTRISGPDLMWSLLERCASDRVTVYLYGSSPSTLEALVKAVQQATEVPVLAGAESPPFRPLTQQEDDEVVARLNSSGAGVVFVGLGCPKQEQWLAAHRGRVSAVMIGVGAAFDFHAGALKRAPRWMQYSGLEWLHRILIEPRRLIGRYLITNALFCVGVLRQWLPRRGRRANSPGERGTAELDR